MESIEFEMKVYFADIEFLFEEGAKEPRGAVGGSVYVYYLCNDVRELLNVAKREFRRRHLRIIHVESVFAFEDSAGFESEEDQQEAEELVDQAVKSKELMFCTFYNYLTV